MNISFNRRTHLALAALQRLAAANGRVSRTQLAEAIGTTPSFLPQVLSPILQGGWVTSGRGPGGGYEITDAAFDARLLDVVEATQGPAENGRCVLRGGPCPGEEICPVHEVWSEARRTLVDGLDAIPALSERSEK